MISESKFHMWRTLFSLVHADDVIAKEELDFMRNILGNINFSDEQKEVLQDDMLNPRSPEEMFTKISETTDRDIFFDLAYDLVMVDGDYHQKEFAVMESLQKLYDQQTGLTTNVQEVLESRKDTRAQSYDEVLNKAKKYN